MEVKIKVALTCSLSQSCPSPLALLCLVGWLVSGTQLLGLFGDVHAANGARVGGTGQSWEARVQQLSPVKDRWMLMLLPQPASQQLWLHRCGQDARFSEPHDNSMSQQARDGACLLLRLSDLG